MRFFFGLLFILGVAHSPLFATLPLGPHVVSIGPEVYHLERKKEGGSRQSGWLYGGHLLYERRKDNGIYWAFDTYYGTGTIKGKSARGSKLKSDISEYEFEGVLGYNFCWKRCKYLTIIPYGGYGYFKSKNSFKKPSPMIFKTDDHYQYGAGGVELSFRPTANWEYGVRGEVQYMTEGKSLLDKDEKYGKLTFIIDNKIQYEVDLLLRHRRCLAGRTFNFLLMPFYQQRHLGGQINWPYNFISTKFRSIGLRCLVQCVF